MAIMIPPTMTDDHGSRAESRVFKALQKNLDDTWHVFHSFTQIGQNKQNRFIDSETDFLIFHPEKGLLTLEVKGGQISCANNQWFQNDKPMKQSPANQAKLCKYNLLEYLTTKLNRRPQLPIGHAVCLPDCYGELDQLPADTYPIAINGDMLTFIGDEIPRILADFNRDLNLQLDPKQSKQILELLAPHFSYGNRVSDRIAEGELILRELNHEQELLLQFIGNQKQVLIEGCAGSGKTVMAILKARELAKTCDQVLLLCFNQLLGQKISEYLADCPNVRVETYHKFCLNELIKNGYEFTYGNYPDAFWNETIPEKFADLQTESPIKFDALIVDEAQDFREEYWISIADLVKDDGWFYIFYDPEQNLYKTQMAMPKLSEPFKLRQNCRNSRQVFNFIQNYTDHSTQLHHDAPEGVKPELFTVNSDQESRKTLSRILANLIDKEEVQPENIVILGGHSMAKTALANQEQIGKFRISENGQDANAIPYYSLMRFKGCEAEVVILLDVDETDPRWSSKNLYTAASRAKHALFVIKRS